MLIDWGVGKVTNSKYLGSLFKSSGDCREKFINFYFCTVAVEISQKFESYWFSSLSLALRCLFLMWISKLDIIARVFVQIHSQVADQQAISRNELPLTPEECTVNFTYINIVNRRKSLTQVRFLRLQDHLETSVALRLSSIVIWVDKM